MAADHYQELRETVAVGRSMALESDLSPHQSAAPEVEAKLSGLLTVAIGMFVAAMTSIIVVGMTLF